MYEQESATRKVYVHGIKELGDKYHALCNFFSSYGTVLAVTFPKQSARTWAFVEFQDKAVAEKVAMIKEHFVGGHCVHVEPFKYQPPHSEKIRQLQEETQQKDRTMKAELHSKLMANLATAESISDQMSHVSQTLGLTPEDVQIRTQICNQLSNALSDFFPGCKVFPFGSSVNTFGAKGCDLDMFLELQDPGTLPADQEVQLSFRKDLKSLKGVKGPVTTQHLMAMELGDKVKLASRIVSSKPEFSATMIIPSQRCPIVRFHHLPTNIKCDLSLNNRKALLNSHLLRVYGSGSGSHVHQLVSVVRYWAQVSELAGGTSGGHFFSNYALTQMVLFYAMKCEPPLIPPVTQLGEWTAGMEKEVVDGWTCVSLPPDAVLQPKSENMESAVDLLKGFFNFYATKINWSTDALAMSDATILAREDMSKQPDFAETKMGCITVLDPFVLSHNVTGNVNEKTLNKFMTKIKQAAAQTENLSAEDKGGTSTESWGIAALLTPEPQSKAAMARNSDDRKTATPSHKSQTARLEGELPDGYFRIMLKPQDSVLSSQLLKKLAEAEGVPPDVVWCRRATDMVLSVLSTVFLVEVERGGSGNQDTSLHQDGPMDGDLEKLQTILRQNINAADMNIKLEEGKDSIESTNEGKELDAHALFELDANASQDVVASETEGELREPRGKRSSELANLDTPVIMDSSEKFGGDQAKRVCTGISVENRYSVSSVKGAESSKMDVDDSLGRITSERIVKKRESLSCLCKHRMWMGRKKLKGSIRGLEKLSGLDLERETSRALMNSHLEQIKNLQISQNQDGHPVDSKSDANGKASVPTVPPGGGRINLCSIQFSCTVDQVCGLSDVPPHIVITMHPHPQSYNDFKEFFVSFKSLITKLIHAHLFNK